MYYDQTHLGMRIRDYLNSRAERVTEKLGAVQREIMTVGCGENTTTEQKDRVESLKRQRDSLIDEYKTWEGHASRMDKKYKEMVRNYPA